MGFKPPTPVGAVGADALTAVVNASADRTAAVGDVTFVDATNGNVTITLPTTPAALSRVLVKKVDTSANTVTIVAHGSGLIDRASSYVISVANGSATCQCLASDTWKIVSDVSPQSAQSGSASIVATTVAAAGSTETLTAPATGAANYDVTLTADCTVTLAGGSAGYEASLTVRLRQGGSGGYEVTWPDEVEWTAQQAPLLSTEVGQYDVVVLFTTDGGVSWSGGLAWSALEGVTPAVPVFTVDPVISGTGVVGDTLTCNGGQVTGHPTPTKTYQWKRDGTNRSGETASTYVVVSGDIGHAITCTVTATNSGGSDTGSSNTITGLAAATAPDAPTSLILTPGDTTIAAAWTAPASNGGSAITTYLVEYRTPNGSGSYTTFPHGASTTPSITITGLTNASAYGVRVSAVNAVGTGTPTSEGTATPVAGGSVVVEDDFTDTDAVDLVAHTVAPTGGPWTQELGGAYGSSYAVKSNRVFCGGDFAHYMVGPAPATNEYDIEIVLRCVSATGFVALLGRASWLGTPSFVPTHYEFRISGSGGLTLYEVTAGNYVSLDTAAQTFTPGQDYTIKAQIRTATKKLFVDGVEKMSDTTNTITQVGKAGLSGGTATTTTGLHIASLKVTDA